MGQLYIFNKNNSQTEDYLPLAVNGNPIGTIIAFGGAITPEDYLLCDGSLLNRTIYSELFTVIGTTYGAGDGSTTFSLPNLTNRVMQGNSSNGVYRSAGLPTITGWVTYAYGVYRGLYGAFYNVAQNGTGSGANYPNSGQVQQVVYFDASKSNSIYGSSSTVQPPAMTIKYIIKFR